MKKEIKGAGEDTAASRSGGGKSTVAEREAQVRAELSGEFRVDTPG